MSLDGHTYHACSDCGLGHTRDGITGRTKALQEENAKLKAKLALFQEAVRAVRNLFVTIAVDDEAAYLAASNKPPAGHPEGDCGYGGCANCAAKYPAKGVPPAHPMGDKLSEVMSEYHWFLACQCDHPEDRHVKGQGCLAENCDCSVAPPS